MILIMFTGSVVGIEKKTRFLDQSIRDPGGCGFTTTVMISHIILSEFRGFSIYLIPHMISRGFLRSEI